ncbi:hypothetical protein BDA99DRAFT_543426 [Phascolomyces articulosus]|uniref:Uncharacterized protein n=1 Tax=Phascolomyces articulosus TaxID=60185 RepID=A0AAD5JX38_9FUNG|nr:hypothetical protein BDA99DRAFT_543426 [Phascolomyces articulosus]
MTPLASTLTESQIKQYDQQLFQQIDNQLKISQSDPIQYRALEEIFHQENADCQVYFHAHFVMHFLLSMAVIKAKFMLRRSVQDFRMSKHDLPENLVIEDKFIINNAFEYFVLNRLLESSPWQWKNITLYDFKHVLQTWKISKQDTHLPYSNDVSEMLSVVTKNTIEAQVLISCLDELKNLSPYKRMSIDSDEDHSSNDFKKKAIRGSLKNIILLKPDEYSKSVRDHFKDSVLDSVYKDVTNDLTTAQAQFDRTCGQKIQDVVYEYYNETKKGDVKAARRKCEKKFIMLTCENRPNAENTILLGISSFILKLLKKTMLDDTVVGETELWSQVFDPVLSLANVVPTEGSICELSQVRPDAIMCEINQLSWGRSIGITTQWPALYTYSRVRLDNVMKRENIIRVGVYGSCYMMIKRYGILVCKIPLFIYRCNGIHHYNWIWRSQTC